jgi:hypothetical protein
VGYGILGNSASSSGTGVYGHAVAPSGSTIGGYFDSISPSGTGAYGYATASSGSTIGVYGRSDSSTGIGVYGNAPSAGSGGTFGGYFNSASTAGQGAHCVNTAGSGTTYGVVGEVLSASGYGVYSLGRLAATGTKAFRIDHPADPQNKYLLHYCAEGPEPQNAYNGKATLDGRGEATIELPAYFAGINKDPRYTLTPIGAPMPMLHIAAEIDEDALARGNAANPGDALPTVSFRIAGGVPGGKVSWRVDALRYDRWVQRYGAPVEADKPPDEKGAYQHPELYAQPTSSTGVQP